MFLLSRLYFQTIENIKRRDHFYDLLPNHVSMQLYIEVVLPNFLTLGESREVGETVEAVRLLE